MGCPHEELDAPPEVATPLSLPKLDSNLSAAERAAMIADENYWRALCPKLHVASLSMMRKLAEVIIEPEADLVDELRDRMATDGYWEVLSDAVREDNGEVHLSWAVSVADMAEAMTTLTNTELSIDVRRGVVHCPPA